jgi:hypothetical protein
VYTSLAVQTMHLYRWQMMPGQNFPYAAPSQRGGQSCFEPSSAISGRVSSIRLALLR